MSAALIALADNTAQHQKRNTGETFWRIKNRKKHVRRALALSRKTDVRRLTGSKSVSIQRQKPSCP